jgi:hypothetical protein
MMFDFEALSAADRYKLVVSTVVPAPHRLGGQPGQRRPVNAAPYSFFNAFSDSPW